MTVEKGHKILAHRSIKSLLSGSLHGFWDDYRFITTPDTYCEDCKIAASKVHPHSKKAMYVPKEHFKCLFMDVIPHPNHPGIDKSTTFPYSLLIVEPATKYKWFLGMQDSNEESIIANLKQYKADIQSKNITEEISYIRTDDGTNFMSQEFQQYCQDNKIKITFADPKHQEMNAYSENTWNQTGIMARSMMVHSDLSLHFLYEARRYAVEILNILPAKGIQYEDNNPTTTYYLVNHYKPLVY